MSAAIDIVLGLSAGLAGGAVHVVTGPDHLAAVLPLASQRRRGAVWSGLAWGAGHSIGVLLLGALALGFGQLVDIEGLSTFAERSVGFLLIGLGLWSFRRSRLLVVHSHPHEHGAETHGHAHVHIGDPSVGTAAHVESGSHRRHDHSALGFGVVHGIAGSSHLFGVLPALVLGWGAAAAYFSGFLVGSAVVMGLVAAATGRLFAEHAARMQLGLRLSGAFAVVVGGAWLVHTWT